MKQTYKNRSIFWWMLALIGVLASLVLLISRFAAEVNDKNVGLSVYASDIHTLSAESGLTADFWLGHFASLGVEYILPDYELDSFGPLTPAFVGTSPSHAEFIVPYNADAISDTAPIALIENIERNGVDVPAVFDISTHEGDMVKTLYLFDSYRSRWNDKDSGKEIENLLFRACVERSSRLILLRPFTYADGRIVSSPEAYAGVLSGLGERLHRYNLTLGDGFSCTRATVSHPALFAAAAFLTAALWILVFMQIPAISRFESALCILAAAGLLAAHFLLHALCMKLLPFLCAAVFPCIASLELKKFAQRETSCSSAVLYLKTLAALLVWALLGGLSVSALMTRRAFMMGGAIFSGVKAAEFLPIAVCFFIFLPPILASLRENHSLKRLLRLAAAALLTLFACYFLLIRSGDTALGIGSFETALRNFLEEHLYARPRTKELFFAVPLLSLFVFAIIRKMPVLSLLGAECAVLECVSVINTFCHATAPLALSLVRSLLSAVGGLVFGLILLLILEFAAKKQKKI